MNMSLNFIKPQSYFLRASEGDGGGQGGAGDGGGQGSASDPAKIEAEFKAKLEAEIAKATAGLKSKNEELLGKLKSSQEIAKQFEGLDPAKFKELQARLDNDEDIKLFSEGKKNEVIYKYTERMRADFEAQIQAEKANTEAAAQRANAYRDAVLDNQIRAVAVGMHPGAVEDALLHAHKVFTLDDKGKAVKLDADGVPELGKDGKNPFSPAEWIDLQKELKPHWFLATSSGGGANNAGSGQGGQGKTMKREVFDRLAPHEKAKVAGAGTKIID